MYVHSNSEHAFVGICENCTNGYPRTTRHVPNHLHQIHVKNVFKKIPCTVDHIGCLATFARQKSKQTRPLWPQNNGNNTDSVLRCQCQPAMYCTDAKTAYLFLTDLASICLYGLSDRLKAPTWLCDSDPVLARQVVSLCSHTQSTCKQTEHIRNADRQLNLLAPCIQEQELAGHTT